MNSLIINQLIKNKEAPPGENWYSIPPLQRTSKVIFLSLVWQVKSRNHSEHVEV